MLTVWHRRLDGAAQARRLCHILIDSAFPLSVRPAGDGRQVAVNLTPPDSLLPGGIPLVPGLRVS